MTSLKAASLRRLSELIEGELALLRHELGPVLKLKQRALVANQVTQLQDLAGRELRLGGRLAALEGGADAGRIAGGAAGVPRA